MLSPFSKENGVQSTPIRKKSGSVPDSSVLSLIPHHAGESPILLRHFLDDDMEICGLGARVLHHRVGDRLAQGALLCRRAPGPHLYGHHRHFICPPEGFFRSARGCRPTDSLPLSRAPGCPIRAPRLLSARAASQRRNRLRQAAPRGRRPVPTSAIVIARPPRPRARGPTKK